MKREIKIPTLLLKFILLTFVIWICLEIANEYVLNYWGKLIEYIIIISVVFVYADEFNKSNKNN